jgi:hypothetical protein
MADCQACSRPVPDVAYVCPACERDLAAQLKDAAELWPELQVAVARLARMSEPGPRARGRAPAQPVRPDSGVLVGPICQKCTHGLCRSIRSPDYELGTVTGLPFSWLAAEVAEAVRNTVVTWCRVVLEERHGIQAAPWSLPEDTPGLMRWLAGQLKWLRYQPFAAEAWDELSYACGQIEPAVDRPPPRWLDAGPCLAPTAAGPCRQRLLASPRAANVHCPACGASHSATERSATILAAAMDIRLTAEECAHLLSLHGWSTPAGTVRSWASRRRLSLAGRIRFGEVHKLRVAMRERIST